MYVVIVNQVYRELATRINTSEAASSVGNKHNLSIVLLPIWVPTSHARLPEINRVTIVSPASVNCASECVPRCPRMTNHISLNSVFPDQAPYCSIGLCLHS